MNETTKTDDIGCLEAIEHLYAWLDGELDDMEIAGDIEHHISHCKSCFSRAEMEKSLNEHLRRWAGGANPEGDGVPDSLRTRVDKLLEKL